jgi:hypothetical protein
MKNRQAKARDHQEWRKTTGSQGPQHTAADEDEKICDTDSRVQPSCNSESNIVYYSSTTKFHTQYTLKSPSASKLPQ